VGQERVGGGFRKRERRPIKKEDEGRGFSKNSRKKLEKRLRPRKSTTFSLVLGGVGEHSGKFIVALSKPRERKNVEISKDPDQKRKGN